MYLRFFLLICSLLLTGMQARAARTLRVTAGSLPRMYTMDDIAREGDLILIGTINGSDVKMLRRWSNASKALDLRDCRIVAGGEPYYENYRTEDDVIGSYMFADKELKSLVLPKTLKKIGDYALGFCGESIELPATLTWLGDHAFTKNLLRRLHLPASLVHIGNGALNGGRLREVTVDAGNPAFVMENYCLYTRDHSRLLSYFPPTNERAESFTIRPEVRVIDDRAFNCYRSYNITLNDRLEYIGEEAFKYALDNMAPHQKKLVIPESVTYIGAGAFEYCLIDSVIISDRVDSLPDFCFSGCSIDYIHLPAKLKHIGYAALNNNRMRNLELPDGLEVVEGRALLGLTKSRLVIPSSVRRIDQWAFVDVFADTIDIQAPLDSIPTAAFYNIESTRKLILPPTLKRIGRSAFYACYQLEDCRLPVGLEEIGSYALAGADHLKEWHLPASVQHIGEGAFAVPNFSSHTVYMYAGQPPADTHLRAFAYWTMEKSVLCVPTGCADNYRHRAPWSNFGTIREFDATAVRPLQRTAEPAPARYFDLQGRPVSPDSHGLRIVLTPDGPKKVI